MIKTNISTNPYSFFHDYHIKFNKENVSDINEFKGLMDYYAKILKQYDEYRADILMIVKILNSSLEEMTKKYLIEYLGLDHYLPSAPDEQPKRANNLVDMDCCSNNKCILS